MFRSPRRLTVPSRAALGLAALSLAAQSLAAQSPAAQSSASLSLTAPPLPPAAGPSSAVLEGLRQYLGSFQPVTGETSLLAYFTREALEWPSFQNLFATQTTDAGGRYLEWRGHSDTPAGSIFTTLRAAVYSNPGGELLVVNREWCSAGSCAARTAFAWQEVGGLRPVKDTTVIPLIRDADFYAGAVPACLKGVVLNVSYVPSRKGQTLTALAVAPRTSVLKCAAAGVSAEAATRPLRLNWTLSVGKFRKGW